MQSTGEIVDANSCDCECPTSKGGFLRGRKSTSENSSFFEVLDEFINLYKQKFNPNKGGTGGGDKDKDKKQESETQPQ